VNQNAKRLRLDAKVAVGGDSAGGLAAVVCLICRDRNVNPPIAQVLIYPNTDLAIDTPLMVRIRFSTSKSIT